MIFCLRAGSDMVAGVDILVATQGIAGNWLWWSLLLSGTMAVLLFARLWRRLEVITDVEVVELSHSGGAAAFLRGFRCKLEGELEPRP